MTDTFVEPGEFLVHVAEMALSGERFDAQALAVESAFCFGFTQPEFAGLMLRIIEGIEGPSNCVGSSVPRDGVTKQPLVRIFGASEFDSKPIFDKPTWELLDRIVREYQNIERLHRAGISPTRSMIFTGDPGVGKTLTAKWLASALGKPLVVMNFSAVLNSDLGRTGENLRAVFEFANIHDCVFLLDDFDVIAKRRDDPSEIGDLKRLVSLLIEEIDECESDCLLLATTNRPDLLDPAIWRRFEVHVELSVPEAVEIEELLRISLPRLSEDSAWPKVLSKSLQGSSFSVVVDLVSQAARASVIADEVIEVGLAEASRFLAHSLGREKRKGFAISLTQNSVVSQRQASEITGISRDTIRKHIRAMDDEFIDAKSDPRVDVYFYRDGSLRNVEDGLLKGLDFNYVKPGVVHGAQFSNSNSPRRNPELSLSDPEGTG